MRLWEASAGLVDRIGVSVARSSQVVLEILRGLTHSMAVSSDEKAEFLVLQSDPKLETKLVSLVLLDSKGIVQQVETGREAWSLTEAGRARLRVSHALKCQGLALRLRAGLGVDDACVFELLTLLGDQGWRPQVHVKDSFFRKVSA